MPCGWNGLDGKKARAVVRRREIYYCGNDTSTQFFTASVAEELLLNTELTEENKDRAIHLARGNKVLQVDKYDYTNHYETKKLRDCKASAHILEWRKSPVLSDYNFAANSGSGITFSRKGNALTITATAAAAKNLDTEKTYSATGSAYEIDPDRAVICWNDRTGRYQAMAGYTGVGRDPVKAYIKIKAVEEKGSISVCKVDATGAPLAGAELMLETSADGKTWTEVSRITTDKTGIAKWSDLKIGVQYRITETKAPTGYTLLTKPLFAGALDSSNRDVTITACNNAGFALPFTGGTGFTTYILFAVLALMAGVCFCKKIEMKENTK